MDERKSTSSVDQGAKMLRWITQGDVNRVGVVSIVVHGNLNSTRTLPL